MCVCTGHSTCVYVCLCSSPRRRPCSVNYRLVAGAGTSAAASKGKGKGPGRDGDKGKGKGVLSAVGKGKAGG